VKFSISGEIDELLGLVHVKCIENFFLENEKSSFKNMKNEK